MTLRYIRTIICVIVLITANPAAAQQSVAEEAQECFSHGNYGCALPLIEKLLKNEPDNALLNYQAGICYLHSRSLKPKAVEFLEKAVEHSPSWRTKAIPGPKEAPLDAHKLLGDAYIYAYKFEPAIQTYERYKELVSEKEEGRKNLAEVDLRIDMCRHLKDYRPSTGIPLSAKTGSPCGDLVHGTMTSTLSPDKSTMIYTLKVPVGKLIRQDESSRYFEETNPGPQTDTGKKDRSSTPNPVLERDTVMYATTIGTSYDGQATLTYKNDSGAGNIYISRLKDNRWSNPVKLKKCANRAGWEPYESLSADGKFMYFASDRPGGYGGMDIYRCKMQPDGEWSKAVNLGPSVNTENDEIAPFIHADGVTLFFSSNRIRPGSFDIFSSTATASNWEKPVNVGFPINKDDKDIFQVNADPKKLYASTKPGSPAFKKPDSTSKEQRKKVFRADRDNYLITFTGQQKVPLNLRRGTVTNNKASRPVAANITVWDNKSGELCGKYHTTDRNGSFTFVLPAGKNLHILYEADSALPISENIDLGNEKNYFEEYKAVALPLMEEGATATLSNIFFDENKTEINTALSKLELERLTELLTDNPGMKIELVNSIYSAGDGGFYKQLAKDRVKAVKDYLISKGVAKKRVSASGKRKNLEVPEETEEQGRKKKRRQPEKTEVKPVQQLSYKITQLKKENQ